MHLIMRTVLLHKVSGNRKFMFSGSVRNFTSCSSSWNEKCLFGGYGGRGNFHDSGEAFLHMECDSGAFSPFQFCDFMAIFIMIMLFFFY